MGNFNRDGASRGGDRGGSRGGFGGGKFGGKPSFQKKEWGNRETTMHKAVCSDCSKNCEVPFRPTGEKPVLCKDCFGGSKDNTRSNDRGSDTNSYPARKSFDTRFENREPFGAKKSAGDREMRPLREYKAPSPNGGAFGEDVKKTLSEMNSKLDRLVNTLEKLAAAGQIGGQVTTKVTKAATVEKVTPTAKKEAVKEVLTKVKPLPAPVSKASKKVVATSTVKKVVAKKVVAAKPTAKVAAKPVVKKVVTKVAAKKVTKK
jgi:CxxC-x17-CxxC domain-containing protein